MYISVFLFFDVLSSIFKFNKYILGRLSQFSLELDDLRLHKYKYILFGEINEAHWIAN